jgi:hypothetical protein
MFSIEDSELLAKRKDLDTDIAAKTDKCFQFGRD